MSGSTVAQTPYEQLLLEFSPRAIRSRTQYDRVVRQVDRLMRKPRLSRAEDDLLELLASLIAQYEQTHFPAPGVTPGAMLAHLMEVRGVTADAVARATAIPAPTIARYVAGLRPIPNAGRAKLAKYFHVSPDLLLPVA